MTQLSVQKVPAPDDRSLPIFAEFEKLADRIRLQAYNLFSRRGGSPGHALDDWLAAEHELCWPAAQLVERDDAFALEVALAGFESSEITVTATPREVIVKAVHKAEKAESKDEKGLELRWSEFRSNDVYRRVELPRDIVVDKVTASLHNGLLKIVAPKSASGSKPTAVKVTAAT
jgi:HSP20 family molecular chaperone IbpA